MSYPHKHLKPLAVLASVMGNPLQNKLKALYTLFPGLIKSTYSRLQDQQPVTVYAGWIAYISIAQ